MASTTLPNLPPNLVLEGTELVWINVNGIDYRTTTAQIAALAGGGGGGLIGVFVETSGVQLFTGAVYSVATDRGAFSGTLPPLITVPVGAFLEVQDAAYNAGVNSYTVNASGADTISGLGSSGLSSFALTLNDAVVRFTKSLTTLGAPYWRAIPYGF